MKAKELIRMLQGLDPESNVSFSVGRDDEYRAMCAKAELIDGECLGCLSIDRMEIYPSDTVDSKNAWADIVLEQYNYSPLEDVAHEFDKKYMEIPE